MLALGTWGLVLLGMMGFSLSPWMPQEEERGVFGPEPIKEALLAGKQYALKRKHPLWVEEPVKREVGWWFNGTWRQAIEFVWWYSPEFVSARLGFLSVQEGWDDEEILRRWEVVRSAVGSRVVFFVQLAGAPKMDFFSGVVEEPARLEEVTHVRFKLLLEGQGVSPSHVWLARVEQSRSRDLFTGFPWYHFAPGAQVLLGEKESFREDPIVRLGDFHLYLYRVEFPLEAVKPFLERGGRMQLVVESARKHRVARYVLKEVRAPTGSSKP
jgi:hypothetical protein